MVLRAKVSVAESGQTVIAGKSSSFKGTLSIVLVLGSESQPLKIYVFVYLNRKFTCQSSEYQCFNQKTLVN